MESGEDEEGEEIGKERDPRLRKLSRNAYSKRAQVLQAYAWQRCASCFLVHREEISMKGTLPVLCMRQNASANHKRVFSRNLSLFLSLLLACSVYLDTHRNANQI